MSDCVGPEFSGEEPASRLNGLLTPSVYLELRRIAVRYLWRERRRRSLCPTELVHEAYLQMASGTAFAPSDLRHLKALAAIVMWHILVDRARKRAAGRNGGGWRFEVLRGDERAPDDPEIEFLEFETRLRELAREDGRAHRIFVLRYFGGLSPAEIGPVFRLTASSIEKISSIARAALFKDLGQR